METVTAVPVKIAQAIAEHLKHHMARQENEARRSPAILRCEAGLADC